MESMLKKPYRRCLMAILLTLGFELSAVPRPCPAEDKPAMFQVERDFEELWRKCDDCTRCIRFSGLELVGMESKGKSAKVKLSVVGGWAGLHNCKRVSSSACKGFSPKGAVLQKVTKTLVYRKFDSRWILESCR